jgi:hypothetical protein
LVIVAGALAAALAGANVGARERPDAPLAPHALGPRTDFDLAAHPATAPPPPATRNPAAAG